jgi:ankyrin repeat protein
MIPDYALIDAIKRDNELDFRAALAAGASLAARDLNGASPLEVAESRGASNTAREILALGADLNQRLGTHKRTLLHRAVQKGNFGFTRLLIDHGADVNAQDWHGKRPLHFAASGGHQFLCLELLEAGAEVNAKNHLGKTPLHFAARKGSCPAIKTLLAHGADAKLADNTGTTPSMDAARAGNFEAAKLLIKSSTYGEQSLKVEATRAMKVAEKAGHAEVVQAIHEEFGIPVSQKQQRINWSL